MSDQALAAIIAAFITAVGTGIFTRFDDIVGLFRRANRNVSGTWEVYSYYGGDNSWMGDYVITFSQIGASVKGEMQPIKLREKSKSLHQYAWRGKILGDYLMYECRSTTPNTFKVSTGILYIHVNGEEMSGHFAGNSGAERTNRTWTASTKLKRKK